MSGADSRRQQGPVDLDLAVGIAARFDDAAPTG
jgi:hypothetical protein